MKVKCPLPDLVTLVHAEHEAMMAKGYVHDNRFGDQFELEVLRRKALAAIHRHHAAMVALGLDPLCPHPLKEAEVWKQINDAEISIWHLRRKSKKEAQNAKQRDE